MNERSGEWRFPADPADETVLVSRIACRHVHARALALVSDRADAEVLLQGGFTPLVDDTGRGGDLGIAVRGNVLHEEIDKPASLLKRGEKADDLGIGLVGGWRNGRFSDRPLAFGFPFLGSR